MIYEMLDKFADAQGEIVSGAVLSYDGRNITTDAFRATVGSHCSVILTSGVKIFGEVIRVSNDHNVISSIKAFKIFALGIVFRLRGRFRCCRREIVYWGV